MYRNRSSDAARAIQPVINHSYAGPERRRAVRVNVRQLKCNLGRVLDISSRGARLISRRKLRGWHVIRLFDRDGDVHIDVEVRRSRRLGLFKHEIGLQFLKVPPDIAAKLTTLIFKNRI